MQQLIVESVIKLLKKHVDSILFFFCSFMCLKRFSMIKSYWQPYLHLGGIVLYIYYRAHYCNLYEFLRLLKSSILAPAKYMFVRDLSCSKEIVSIETLCDLIM
jgi:hypothetical protein